MNRAEPLRRTILKLNKWKRGQKALRRASRKRQDEKPERDRVRRAVFERDGYRCQAEGWRGQCFGTLTAHHLKKASARGAYTEDNLISMCAYHNSEIEDRPLEAQERGWVIR